MKAGLSLLVFFIYASFIAGQSFSEQIDSISHQRLIQVAPKYKQTFQNILNQRSIHSFFERIDTSEYDFAFIQETYSLTDTTKYIIERYFREKDKQVLDYKTNLKGVIPYALLYNGNPANVQRNYFSTSIASIMFSNLIDYYYTMDTLLFNYQENKPVQSLVYDASLKHCYTTDTINLNKINLEAEEIERLKTTYVIITLIDRRSQSIMVSFQLPDLNPKLHIEFVKMEYWDW